MRIGALIASIRERKLPR